MKINALLFIASFLVSFFVVRAALQPPALPDAYEGYTLLEPDGRWRIYTDGGWTVKDGPLERDGITYVFTNSKWSVE